MAMLTQTVIIYQDEKAIESLHVSPSPLLLILLGTKEGSFLFHHCCHNTDWPTLGITSRVTQSLY